MLPSDDVKVYTDRWKASVHVMRTGKCIVASTTGSPCTGVKAVERRRIERGRLEGG